jgi:hypothetical protein
MKATEKAKVEIDKLVEMFEHGNAPEAIAKIALSCKDMPSSKWTLANRLMAFSQTAEMDCRGFNQWKEIGRFVQKGAKAAYILRPIIIKDKDESDADAEIKLVGFACLPVFPLSQTEGKPLPELTPETPPALSEVAKKLNIHVEYQHGDCYYGVFMPTQNKIVLCTHNEQTFLHELSHAAHQVAIGKQLKNGQDPKQEIVEELSACVLARMYGKQSPNEGYTFNYINAYAQKMKKDIGSAILTVMKDVEKTLSIIINTKKSIEMSVAA